MILSAGGVRKTFHRGLWPRRRAIEVLRGASIKVRAGELVGFVGENGSGKSTLMRPPLPPGSLTAVADGAAADREPV